MLVDLYSILHLLCKQLGFLQHTLRGPKDVLSKKILFFAACESSLNKVRCTLEQETRCVQMQETRYEQMQESGILAGRFSPYE